ncbi:MAG: site-specific integrase [Comamonadaceae bacterium]
MRETTSLGPWIRRFLLEHLVSERNLAANTRCSYRDTLCQLLPFVSARLHKAVDRLAVVDVSSKLVREFLSDVESSRGCGIATRNQRLAAIHALARFIGEHSPEHLAWCAQARCVPYIKGTHASVPYLDKAEIRRTCDGRFVSRTQISSTASMRQRPRRGCAKACRQHGGNAKKTHADMTVCAENSLP